MARLSASVLVASLAMASATQRTYHDITVGGGTWISEVRWSLHCYTSASTSGCTTGCEAPITYSYTTAGGSTSTGTGNSYTGPNGVYIRYGQLSLRTAANWCTLTMLDTANDGWQNNRWRAPSMGVPSAGYTLSYSQGGTGSQTKRCCEPVWMPHTRWKRIGLARQCFWTRGSQRECCTPLSVRSVISSLDTQGRAHELSP